MKQYAYIDIETDTKQSRIWLCCVNDVVFYEPHTLEEYMNKYLGDVYYVAHNGIAFDFHWLKQLWNVDIPEDRQEDTLVLSRLFNADREGGHSLEAWGNTLGFPKMEQQDFDKPNLEYLATYCKQDVALLKRVHEALLLESEGFSEQCIQLEYEAARVFAQQERYGWKVDTLKILELKAKFDDELVAIEKQMQEMFQPIVHKRVSEKTGKPLKDRIEVFNPGSRQQIVKRLRELGWKPDKKTEKGNFILDEGVLDDIIAQCSHVA
jgi:hypothetical protein